MGRTFASKEDAERAMHHTLRSAKGRIEAAQRQNQPQPAAPPAQSAPALPYDAAVYEELKRTYGEANAERWRLEETAKFNAAQIRKEVDERLAPLEQERAANAQTQKTIVLFSDAKSAVDAQGNLKYPELSHPQAHRAVLDEWQKLHPEQALTPEGVETAVFLFRGKAASGQMRRSPQPPGRQAPSGQSASPAAGGSPMPGSAAPASAQPKAPGIPRYKQVDPLTGEVF